MAQGLIDDYGPPRKNPTSKPSKLAWLFSFRGSQSSKRARIRTSDPMDRKRLFGRDVLYPQSIARLSASRFGSGRLQECRQETESTSSIDQTPDCKIGSYATGQVDYHDLIRKRLNQLTQSLATMFPDSMNRGVVDTAPLLERDFARLAGIGWIGKNTLLLNRNAGSYFFLAALLTSVELAEDNPFEEDHCGSCTACLDACPTSAFVQPRVLDASRCISYLTIEYGGIIPNELSQAMDGWIFGCDVCQMVCPWNRKRDVVVPIELQPTRQQDLGSLEHWLEMDETNFRRLYRHTPFWRTKLNGMRRNAMIAAANSNRTDLRPLVDRFATSDDEVLRATSRWCSKKWN
jgi:epoxyqueuosine reductase